MSADLAWTTLWLSVIIAARYLALAGGAYWLFWGRGETSLALRPGAGRLNRRAPEPKSLRREIALSLISAPIYAFPAAAALEGWRRGVTKLYVDPSLYGWAWLPASAAIYLLAHDAFYYGLHRAMHLPGVFKWTHRGHHRSNDPSPWASFAFDPAEALLTAWFLPALTLFVPIHVGVALGLLTAMTLTAILNHAGCEIWPRSWLSGPVGRWIITARHHDAHHKGYGVNFGLYFRLWDRLCGTDQDGRP